MKKDREVTILVRSNIRFDILSTIPSTNTDNECITILLKDKQISITASIIYIPPASPTDATYLNNIKFGDNVIISGDLNAYHADSNCNKTDKWGIALKKALYNEKLFMI